MKLIYSKIRLSNRIIFVFLFLIISYLFFYNRKIYGSDVFTEVFINRELSNDETLALDINIRFRGFGRYLIPRINSSSLLNYNDLGWNLSGISNDGRKLNFRSGRKPITDLHLRYVYPWTVWRFTVIFDNPSEYFYSIGTFPTGIDNLSSINFTLKYQLVSQGEFRINIRKITELVR